MSPLFLLPTLAAVVFGVFLGLATQRSQRRGVPVPPLGRSIATLGGLILAFALAGLVAGILLSGPISWETEIPLMGIFITGPMGAFLGLMVYLWFSARKNAES